MPSPTTARSPRRRDREILRGAGLQLSIGFYRDTPGLNAAVNPTFGVLLRGPERSEGHVSSNDLVRQRSFTSIGRASVAPRLGRTSDAHGDG